MDQWNKHEEQKIMEGEVRSILKLEQKLIQETTRDKNERKNNKSRSKTQSLLSKNYHF